MTAAGLTFPVLVGSPAAATATEPLERPDVAAAAALARQVRQPVQVSGLTTELSDTAANPDGSLTARFSSSPVRVRQGERWTAVDTTLRRDTDGSVVAAATVSQLRFSGGGTGPAVQLTKAGKTLHLWWPTALPAPTLSADTATYPQVWPGVDLVLTARADGFSEVLVLRDRPAATNPALRTLRLRLSVSGLRLRSQGGGFVAEDSGTGAVVFTSGAPLMWDSAGGPARQPLWPVHGDRVTAMAASLSGSDLTVLPDVTVLDDPATTYPVYVDPAVSGSRNEWAMISSGFPTQSYYKFAGDEGVGLCDVQVEGACNRDQVKRLAWEFGISTALHGTHVLSATFSAYETFAWDCTADDVQLWRVGEVTTAKNWNNHAGTWGRLLSTVNVARRSGCTNGPGWVGFDATTGAQEFADYRWPGLTVGLKAGNEGSMSGGWKRFRNDATLSVTYNSRPATPTNLAVENTACGASAVFVPSASPGLRGHIFDPDGDTDLTAQYAWDRWNTATNAWDRIGDLYKPNQSSNTDPIVRPGVDPGTVALQNGRRYRFTIATLDPWTFNNTSGTDYSGWAPWCEFEVDLQNPTAAPEVSSTDYPEYIPGVDEEYHGQVGLTGAFTFTAAGVTDVAGFKWSWASTPNIYVPAQSLGGQAVVDITPPPPYPDFPTSEGTLTLSVRSVDRAGRAGPIKQYPMRVGPGGGPTGWWRLDEPAGASSLADSTTDGPAHPATPTAVTLGSAGRLLSGPNQTAPTTAWFNGASSYATTGTPVVDTSKSFTVSAWVRPDANSNGWRAILSATGGQASSFFLRRDNDNRFHFTVVAPGVSSWTQAVSTSTSRVGTWTHLLAVYDAGADQAQIYVNGVREHTVAVPAVYQATGGFEIGRSWWANSWGYHPNWHGAIAEVKVWPRVVSEFEAPTMAATQVGAWSLDGHGGDDSDWGRTLTPAPGGVTWGAGKAGDAAVLDGVSGQLATAGPAVRTDQSFTVVCWARADANSNGYRSVVAANGSVNSAFFLRRDPSNKWNFTWVNDTTAGGGSGTTATTIGTWYHLAVVYDAHRQQAYLYVNSQREATIGVASILAATGPLMVGHDIWVGNPDFHKRWHGAVDEVRIYAGTLPASEISKLYVS